MEWNPEKQLLLENYITNYNGQLNDTRLFYNNLDWNYIFNLVGVNDQEFLMLKIDEIYDESINVYFKDDFNINQLVDHWKSKSNPIYQEVVQIVESLGLESFKLEVLEESSSNQTPAKITTKTETIVTTPTTAKRVSSTPVPKLTKTERRLSLDLMHPRPSFGLNQESQLVKPPITSTTNIHVHAQQETASDLNPPVNLPSKKKFTFNKAKFTISTNKRQQEQQTNTAPRQQRTSTVDEQLPLYIRKQLTKNRPQQTITPKPSKHQFAQNSSPTNSSPRGSYKRSSRIQNLLSNSQSLYVHSKDPANSAETSTHTSNDTDLRLRYYSDELDDEDNREYILPDLLTRYFGVHEDQEAEDNTDNDADDDSEEEEEEEEENDFVNVGDDHDDYLFKI